MNSVFGEERESMESKNKVVLRTEKLTKKFGTLVAVNDVSLEIFDGEVHAIIGPNGAGKTTFMDNVINRTTPTSGRVFFEGKEITKLPPYRIVEHGISKCFQISKLFTNQTCVENVRVALIVKHGKVFDFMPKSPDYLRDEAIEILKMVGIEHLADNTAAYLSYGDQRRLEIALALALKPKLLLLDEPTAGVSRTEGYAIMDMILSLVKEEHITVIFIEHDMDIIFNYADRISVMNHGTLVATDTPENIRKNEFVKQAYLGGE